MGGKVTETDFAKEAKDLLEGKDDSFFDVTPMKNSKSNLKFLKMIMIVPGNSILPKEVEKLRSDLTKSGFGESGLHFYNRDDGKIVIHFAASNLEDYIVTYVKDFYDWVVKI